jgi:hypothetical protein
MATITGSGTFTSFGARFGGSSPARSNVATGSQTLSTSLVGRSRCLTYRTTTSYTVLSTREALRIGDIPLAVFERSTFNGAYSLGVCFISSVVDTGKTMPFESILLSTGEKTNRPYLMMSVGYGTATVATQSIYMNGVPLAINEKNELLVTSVNGSSPDQIGTVTINGFPMTALRIGRTWYLAVGTE